MGALPDATLAAPLGLSTVMAAPSSPSSSMQVTVSLLPVSLSLVHIPRCRLLELSHPIIRQILLPNPSFLNLTCNQVELSIFAYGTPTFCIHIRSYAGILVNIMCSETLNPSQGKTGNVSGHGQDPLAEVERTLGRKRTWLRCPSIHGECYR